VSYDNHGYVRPWYVRKRFLAPVSSLLMLVTCAVLLPVPDAPRRASVTSADAAEVTDGTVAMSFDSCNGHIRTTAGKLGIAPVNIVETNSMRIVRFPATDGSVLVTCSAEDGTMAVIRSDNPG